MISIVSITFNNHSELINTIKSVERIPYIEHIVVNGGSSQETTGFLKTFSGKFISEKDHGISDAFNKGLSLASGLAVGFLNSGDVLIDQSYYSEALEIFQSKPDVGYVHADIEFIDSIAGSLTLKPKDTLPNMPFMHPTLIVRKEIIERIGGFDLQFKSAMDLDFAYRLIKSGANGHYIPRAVVRMDGRGISSSRPFLGISEKYKVVLKNKDFNFKTWLKLSFAFFRTTLRVILIKIGLQNVILTYRRKKYLYSK
ncbi:MAG: glycosyltransferase [Bacteriovoracaceae bacterium]|nr:glycosyltransferase [Bacteriovoracaceae bacterium]